MISYATISGILVFIVILYSIIWFFAGVLLLFLISKLLKLSKTDFVTALLTNLTMTGANIVTFIIALLATAWLESAEVLKLIIVIVLLLAIMFVNAIIIGKFYKIELPKSLLVLILDWVGMFFASIIMWIIFYIIIIIIGIVGFGSLMVS